MIGIKVEDYLKQVSTICHTRPKFVPPMHPLLHSPYFIPQLHQLICEEELCIDFEMHRLKIKHKASLLLMSNKRKR